MKWFIRIVLCLATTVFATAAVVNASCPVRVRTVAVVHHAPAVVAAVYATPIVYAQVPAYSASYGQSGVDQGTLQALVQQLQALRAEVQALKQGNGNGNGGGVEPFKGQQGPPPMPGTEKVKAPQEQHPALGIFAQKCASCHGAGVAGGKGGGFVLDPQKMTEVQAFRISREVFSGRMPRGTKGLSDEEVSAVMSFLDTLK